MSTQKQDILKSFLWESFEIDSYTARFEKLSSLPDTEKETVFSHIALQNIFLLRRVRDPGFYLYIEEEIFKDPAILRRQLPGYINNLRYREVDNLNHELFSLHPGESKNDDNDSESQVIQPLTSPFDSQSQFAQNAVQINQNSIDFFKKRLARAVEKEQVYEIQAIEHLLREFSTHKFQGTSLFKPASPYKGSTYEEQWQFFMKRLLLQNINYYNPIP